MDWFKWLARTLLFGKTWTKSSITYSSYSSIFCFFYGSSCSLQSATSGSEDPLLRLPKPSNSCASTSSSIPPRSEAIVLWGSFSIYFDCFLVIVYMSMLLSFGNETKQTYLFIIVKRSGNHKNYFLNIQDNSKDQI